MWYQWPAYLALLCVGAVGWWLSRIARALNAESARVERAERERTRREERPLVGAGR